MTPQDKLKEEDNASIRLGKILAHPLPGDEVVITGLAGMYPDSTDVHHFRDNLFNKVDMVSCDDRRWEPTHPEIPQRTGKVFNIDKFDAGYFGIHERQATSMDPMLRMLLERSTEAIFDAGLHPSDLEGTKTGVFIGVCFSETEKTWFFDKLLPQMYSISGTERSMLANRISYFLKLQGPSFICDTACSSSLYALEQAYRAIRTGQCDSAIVAGSNLCLHPFVSLQFARLGVLSANGICKVFDKDGSGYVRSEAICAIVLQKQKSARRVYCNVLHAKVNCDGYKDSGITYPSGEMQVRLLREFYEESSVGPNELSFLEAHGTGTKVGDPEELLAIEEIFVKNRKEPLLVGSVKSNIGHSEPVSGLCSITKAIIALETGYVPPNLYYNSPRPGIKSLEDGRLKVVTEKIPFMDDRGVIGVNSFGFGGGNCHILLQKNKKNKSEVPKDNVPRLVCVSGRNKEAITSLLDDIYSNGVDLEHIRLFHEVFRKDIKGHLHRGFSVVSNSKEILRSSKPVFGQVQPISIIFTELHDDLLTVVKSLHGLPVFLESLKRIDTLLASKGLSMKGMLTEVTNGNTIANHILSKICLLLAFADIIKQVEIKVENVFGISLGGIVSSYFKNELTLDEAVECGYLIAQTASNFTGEPSCSYLVFLDEKQLNQILPKQITLTAITKNSAVVSGPKSSMNKFLDLLKNHRVNVQELKGPCYNFRNEQFLQAASSVEERLANIINPKKAKKPQEVAESIISSLVNIVSLKDILKNFKKDDLLVEIGDGFLENLKEVNLKEKSYLSTGSTIESLLECLGRLFENGHNPQIQNIFPEIQFPVSRGTPMISPKVKWIHEKNWWVTKYESEDQLEVEERTVGVMLNDPGYTFIGGHVIDGRNLFPATGYLQFVWETLAHVHGLMLIDMHVVFENCKFKRACTVPTGGVKLELTVMIQRGSGNFEVIEGGTIVVTGRIYMSKDLTWEPTPIPIPVPVNNQVLLPMDKKDIYKELRLRGYNYKGEFRALQSCDNQANVGTVKWTGNWITFMDNLLQMKILQEDTRLLYVPIGIQRLTINSKNHLKYIKALGDVPDVPVYISKETGIIRAGCIEIKGLNASSIAKRKYLGTPVLEKYEFVPNVAKLTVDNSIRVNIQLGLENLPGIKVKVVEVVDEATASGSEPLASKIHEVLGDLPLIQANITVFSKDPIEIENAKVENGKLLTETDCFLVVASKVLQRASILQLALGAIKENGYILSREPLDFEIPSLEEKDLQILTIHTTEQEKIFFFRKKTVYKTPAVVNASCKTQDFSWLPILKKAVKKESNVVVFTQDEPLSGVLGLVNCIRREPGGSVAKSVFIMDAAPKFDPADGFYEVQLRKNLAVNVLKDGQWGTYRHLRLPNKKEIKCEHCYVNSMVRGDLSSLKWIEGTLCFDQDLPSDKRLIYVYNASINFRDVMTASGKINSDVISRDRRLQECVQGFEFSGKDASGRRVMGMHVSGALSTLVAADKHLIWEIPDSWSLEEAATIPVVYVTCMFALITQGKIKKGDTLLIHSGTGGIGQAAITLALHFGCKVYTTVGTPEKREFIKKKFPQLTDANIANSRDLTFEKHIMTQTKGRGVDLVLNSLAEEKLIASVRCLAPGGRFVEIGKFDLANDNTVNLMLMQKGASFHGVMLDNLMLASKLQIYQYLRKLVDTKAIKPLSRTVFKMDETEKAFRYMGTGKHIGKVIIQLRKEDRQQKCPPERLLFNGLPRYFCNPDKTYIVCGGLGGFGLELADWLVLRGCQHLILTSRAGVKTGYQHYRMRIWRSYGCTVEVSTEDITTKEGCERLIKHANSFSPVEAIFNLAVVLKDSILENQTEETFQTSFAPKANATLYLDEVSRKLCPQLKQFVVFSSVSCGRGNAGQSNYGMANAVMERICEKRQSEGFPALAVEWGAVGDVGLVAEMQEEHTELEIGGTLQQRISSCLDVMDGFLRECDCAIVSSMVVAEKRAGAGGADNIIDAVANILGLKDLKTISFHATLAELGMDSMTAVEIKQTLEREFEVFLTAQDIKSMTFSRLQEIQEEKNAEKDSGVKKERPLVGMEMVMRFLPNESTANFPLIKLASKGDKNAAKEKILVLPGIEGNATVLNPLVANLNAEVFVAQFTNKTQMDSIEGMALNILPVLKEQLTKSKPFNLLAYSFGALVAIEIVRLLEDEGYFGTLVTIDGAPDYLQGLTKVLEVDSDEKFQTSLLVHLMSMQMSYEIISKHVESLLKCNTFDERIKMAQAIAGNNSTQSPEHQRDMAWGIYKRCKAVVAYHPDFKLKSKIKLFKPKHVSINISAEDYNLSTVCETPVEVQVFDGNHVTVLESEELAVAVNKVFKVVDVFEPKESLLVDVNKKKVEVEGM